MPPRMQNSRESLGLKIHEQELRRPWPRHETYLIEFASIPAFKRFTASSVLPMLLVQTYAIYLAEFLSFV